MEIKYNQRKESIISSKDSKKSLEGIAFIVFLITLFLSPLIFVSTGLLPFDATKSFVIVFGVLISGLLYAISLLRANKIVFMKNPLAIVSILIIVSSLISMFLSSNISKSFIGQGSEIGSISFLASMFLSMFIISRMVIDNKERLYVVYGSLVTSFLILFVFHISRLFFSPSFLSFGIFDYSTASLIGRWFDLGVFSGIMFILSFVSLNTISLQKGLKVLMYFLLVISGLFLIIVNSTLIWFAIALILLSYGIYSFFHKTGNGAGVSRFFSRLSIVTLILFIVFAVLAWNGNKIVTPLLESFKFEQTEVSLPWQLTLDVAADTIKSKPFFGAGPNHFGSEYLQYKPQTINPTLFWNAEFSAGFGYLPTFAVTHGVVGIILWIVFFVLYFIFGIRGLKNTNDPNSRFSIISTFFISSFLWLIALLYNPSHTILLITFVATGLFIASLCAANVIKNYTYDISQNSRQKGITTTILVILIIVLSLWLLLNVKKVVALSYFQNAISTLRTTNNTGIEKAEKSIRSALAWDNADVYYRAISEIDLTKIAPILQSLKDQSQNDPKNLDQELIKKVNDLIQDAASSTAMAISIDPKNYNNHVSDARVHELAASLEAPNAYERAKSSYSNALIFNPYSPLLYLSLAQLEASKDKADEAQKYIGVALQLKQNYTEAIFLLSQIQVAQGRIKDAIISAQVMTQINPNNSMLFFQLGFLNYSDKNYKDAVEALGKAVELNNQYANARYFLGLSLARLNKYSEAVNQFEEILKTNPDNQEVDTILASLRAGKSPFNDAKASVVDNKPETRKALPVKEKANTNTSN